MPDVILNKNWDIKRLDEIGFVGRGKSKHRPRDAAHLYGGIYPFIQTADVKHSNLYISNFSQTYSDAGLAQSKLWKTGTLCITIAANIADTAILGIDACFPDSVIGFIADENKADTIYVKYLFNILQSQYKRFTQGAAQDNLSQEKLLSMRFSVPPLHLQNKIAEILSAYDDLIENNLRRIELLENAARLIYKEWFVKFNFPGREHTKVVDGVPEGWVGTTLGNLSVFLSRGISPTYDDEAEFTIVNQKCIRKNLLDLGPSRRQSKSYSMERQIQFGDVLINSTGTGTLGRTAMVSDIIPMCTIDSHVTIARPNPGIGLAWYYYTISNKEQIIENMAEGATNQKELPRTRLRSLEMLLPSHSIRTAFEEIIIPLKKQMTILQKSNDKLRQARDLLLPKLMSGEIAV